jgi:hypothetical protein
VGLCGLTIASTNKNQRCTYIKIPVPVGFFVGASGFFVRFLVGFFVGASVGLLVGSFVIATTAGAFVVGFIVVGAIIMLVHHLPLQPASHWSLFVLHQSPP